MPRSSPGRRTGTVALMPARLQNSVRVGHPSGRHQVVGALHTGLRDPPGGERRGELRLGGVVPPEEAAASSRPADGAAFGVDLPPPPDIREDLSIPPLRIETGDEPVRWPWATVSCASASRTLSGTDGGERDRQKRAAEDADRLAGRLRHAAMQAVDTAARRRARDIEGGWRPHSESLGGAMTRAERAAGTDSESARSSRWARGSRSSGKRRPRHPAVRIPARPCPRSPTGPDCLKELPVEGTAFDGRRRACYPTTNLIWGPRARTEASG